jgi:YidC/Oxa1 family membrane protein insertase
MERRVLLAIFLSFLVLFVYQALVGPPRPPAPVGENKAKTQSQPAAVGGRRGEGTKAALPPDKASEAAGRPLTREVEARDVVVETEAVHAVFSTRGAVLTSWRLKHYLDEKGEPLELVPVDVAGEPLKPFSLEFDEAALTARVAEALFEPSAERLELRAGQGTATLSFAYADSAGLAVRKAFVFTPDAAPYLVRARVDAEAGGRVLEPAIVWGPGIGTAAASQGSRYYTPPRAVFFAGGKVSRVRADKVGQQAVHEGPLPFAGVEDHYFLAAALGRQPITVRYREVVVPGAGGADAPRHLVSFAVRPAAPPVETVFFLGPKDFDILYRVQPDLVRAIDFGVFAWLVVPLLRALKWVNGYVGNYGWSIIILTVLINAAMFPLRHKSVVSMRKLQEIQPEVKAIQERYAKLKATDPARQKMNQELMNLYRERGVNPASGCIPMLLTLPVLFAFYSLLSVAIELRRAPFIWWIKDLSAHDPLYITPILMGATMVVQQRMTPSTGDPTQQKIMMLMPLMFTGMFLWAPSGLVIYWFVSNLWAIGQQYLTNRLIGPPRVRAPRPPAERRVKRVVASHASRAGGPAAKGELT